MNAIKKLRVEKDLVLRFSEMIQGEQRDESAVPSYTHHNPLVRWIMFRRLDVVLEMLRQVNPNSKSVATGTGLDFGCGVGLLLPELAKHLKTVYATDICLDGAKETVRHHGCQNVFLLPPKDAFAAIPDDSLQVIIATDVLEHVDNLEELIKVFRTKLSQKGALIISGPTENVIYGICRKIAGFTGDYHVRNIFDIEKVVENLGFQQIQERALPFPMLPKLFRITLFERLNGH